MANDLFCYKCLRRFPPYKVWFRCENTPERNPVNPCVSETDGIMGRMMPHAFPLHGFGRGLSSVFALPKECQCDKCQQVSKHRICPHCHWSIPCGSGEIDAYIIAIVGCTGSGKSHYLTALIERSLKGLVARDFGLSISPDDPDTERIFRENYVAHLIDKKEEIPPTLALSGGATLGGDVNPLIFLLTCRRPNPVTRRLTNRSVYIVFYDIPGERFSPAQVGLTIETEYLFHSSGIIYLVNPLHIQEIAALIPSSAAPVITPEVVFAFMKQKIQERMGLRRNEQIRIPLAISLSQSDRLRDNNAYLGFDPLLFKPHRHKGAFDIPDFEKVNAEIENKLIEWGGMAGSIYQQTDQFFKTKGFFASSALGDSPIGGHIAHINPIRVEDLFLWILSEIGVIPKTRG